MNNNLSIRPLQPGQPAPGFELPAITREGFVTLEDYRGSRPLLIGLFRGLDCPFCRRSIATLGELDGELRGKGIETLAVVNAPVDRARAYIRFRPIKLMAAADERRDVHRAFGLPAIELTEDRTEWPHRAAMTDVMALRLNPNGDLPEPMNPVAASKYLNERDGVDPAIYGAPDDGSAPSVQTVGTFLVDRDGIVRWSFLEAAEGPDKFGGFPATRQFLAAASLLAA